MDGQAVLGRFEEFREGQKKVSSEPNVEQERLRRDQKKRRGRKRITEIVRIINPRVIPSIDFQAHGPNDGMVGASRVFIDDHGSNMHVDWPIYCKHFIGACEAAMIIISNGQSISEDRICTSVPQESTDSAVFIVDLHHLNDFSSNCLSSDGLGLWGVAQSSYTYYSNSGESINNDDSNWAMKVVCEKYVHPGTESCGQFSKSIYTGVSSSGEHSSIAVICYQWEGQSHPITVHVPSEIPMIREELDLSHGTGESWSGRYPIYSHSTVDFDAVSRILLGSYHIEPHRICVEVPDFFRETATFIIDIDRSGGEKLLHTAGGGRWSRPCGASRFFRYEVDSGHWTRVDKGNEGEEEWDVQITSKRYESESDPGLMRKIFLIREKRDEITSIHSSLAVITFYWKGGNESNVVDGGMEGRKRPRFTQLESSVDYLSYSELRQLTLRKESENYERFGVIVNRFETIANRYEQIMTMNEGDAGGIREMREMGDMAVVEGVQGV